MRRCRRDEQSLFQRNFAELIMYLLVRPLVNFSPAFSSNEMETNTEWLSRTSCGVMFDVCVVVSERHQAHLSEDSAGFSSFFFFFYLPSVYGPVEGGRGEGMKIKVRCREGGGGERTVAEVSCTAAAQLSSGRRGHFPLLAIRCNADDSQGYACVAALTDVSSEDARAGSARDND